MIKGGECQYSLSLMDSGSFTIGVNYWASHAGVGMWSNWDSETIEDDLIMLKLCGIRMLRIFPLWSDFQPINVLWGCNGEEVELRFGEASLPDTDAGRAGISEEMVDRLQEFLDLLVKYEMSCVVGLLTGWMSGRLFVPQALEGRNPLTDPMSLRWEVRYIKYLVSHFKDHSAISAWELGNECNCLGSVTREEAYAWTALIANTIKAIDSSRPCLSGMHSLSPDGNWTIFDQAEHTDLLTTHPYPIFTDHCGMEPLNTIRPILHSTAETRYYSELGGKPCFSEEFGTLGSMISSEQVTAEYVRSCLFSLWANDCRGLFWWCAFDQNNLKCAPYDWCAFERELGIIRNDHTLKPIANEFIKFSEFLKSLPFSRLPSCRKHAVCILTQNQDNWGVAYSTYIMAKQAGFEIEFQYSEQPLKDADLYLMPSISSGYIMRKERLEVLYEKIRNGSTLYISIDDGILSNFEELTGLEPQFRGVRKPHGIMVDCGGGDILEFKVEGSNKVTMRATRARVLGKETTGEPAFSVSSYGKGKVYFLNAPLEIFTSRQAYSFGDDDAPEYWRLYEMISRNIKSKRIVNKSDPLLALTEHYLGDGELIVLAVNMSPVAISDILEIADGWQLTAVYYNNATLEKTANTLSITLGKNDGAVYMFKKDEQSR